MALNVNHGILPCDSPVPTADYAIFRPLLMLARQGKTWTPSLLAGVSWRALTNVCSLKEILRLFKLSPFTEAAQSNPRLPFKFLTHDYLARNLTVAERLSCFSHHHRRMCDVLPDHILLQILHGGATLHTLYQAGRSFTLTIGLPRPPNDKEGELSLDLKMGSETVFNLSCSIIPGWVVKSKAAEVLLITRLQGLRGQYPQIRQATKALCSVSPRAILLAAAQGVAEAFGIVEIAAVCATNQVYYCSELAFSFTNSYDEFFIDLGMAWTAPGFFGSSIPITEKPLEEIKRGHKIRTRKKRLLKLEIQLACAKFFFQGDVRTSDCSGILQLGSVEPNVSPNWPSFRSR